MRRLEIITRYITKTAKGIEIGAFHSGLVPKRDGYNSRILDVFTTHELVSRAHRDPTIPTEVAARIEEVDYIGSTTEIEQLVGSDIGQFEYIVSSHNFEHIPNPIKFLQGCCKVLKPGGILSMIIPDRRGCYDYFRPNSATAALIDAYFSKRHRPTYAQVFEHQSLASRVLVEEEIHFTFAHRTHPRQVVPFQALEPYFAEWSRAVDAHDETYVDAHCWTFTPATFELILRDLSFLRLIDLQIISIESSDGEFFVHLRNLPNIEISDDDFYRKRRELLLQANDEASTTSQQVRQTQDELNLAMAELARLRAELDAATSKLSAPSAPTSPKAGSRMSTLLRAARRALGQ